MPADVQLENSHVRVTRWTLEPGDSTGSHRHGFDYVIVPVLDATMEITNADGTATIAALSSGVSYFREGGAEHDVRNGGEGLLDFVEIELLQLSR